MYIYVYIYIYIVVYTVIFLIIHKRKVTRVYKKMALHQRANLTLLEDKCKIN